MSDFSRGIDDWGSVEVGQPGMSSAQFDLGLKCLVLHSVADNSYFVAPDRFLGDQRLSYNRELRFRLKIGPMDLGPQPSPEDIVIEGGGATPTIISVPITAQSNPIPTKDMQEYVFKLHENPEFGWNGVNRPKDFIAVLSNITQIKVRGSYVPQGMGFIDEFVLESAEYGGTGRPATWVERCDCPEGHRGDYCEKCQMGFYHDNNGGPFARSTKHTFLSLKYFNVKKYLIIHPKIFAGVCAVTATGTLTTATWRAACATARTTPAGTTASSALTASTARRYTAPRTTAACARVLPSGEVLLTSHVQLR